MPQGDKRVVYDHPGAAPTHDLTHYLAFVLGIAVDGTAAACALMLPETAHVEPAAGVCQKFGILRRQLLRVQFAAAVEAYHNLDYLLLLLDACHVSDAYSLFVGRLLVIYLLEQGAKALRVGYKLPQPRERPGIWRLIKPQTQIPSVAVLLPQMLFAALPLGLAIELRRVGEAVLHRAADDGLGVDGAVGFGDYASVYRARRP